MKQYYFVNSQGQQMGPVPMEELKNQNIQRNTPVWCEGMTDWTEAGQVPELGFLFASGPTYGYGQGGFSQGSYGNVPPQNPGYNTPMQKPDNYLVWAILCTVLCCIPLGIVAIVYAARVDSLWSEGRYEEAVNSSNKAKKFTIIGAIISVVLGILYFIFAIALGIFSASEELYYY